MVHRGVSTGNAGVPRIIKKIVLIEKTSINLVTKHADETAPSFRLFAVLQVSPLHCRIESLCFHTSHVVIECPTGSAPNQP